MPKIVDPAARRAEVVDAVLRIAERDGLEQATLRNIAAEAGLAIGSVRHYFADHAEVMEVAMRELIERLSTRILAKVEALRAPGADKRAALEELLAEFLPLDEQRRSESAAWLSFVAASRTEERLRPFTARMQDGSKTIMERVMAGIAAGTVSTGAAPALDEVVEADRLVALIDGLTLRGVLQPEAFDAAATMAVVRRHLDSLAAADGGTRRG